MATIVSDSTNPSYDGKLSTANGFYLSRSYNLGTSSNFDFLSTARDIPVTFTGAGVGETCNGVVIALMNPVSGPYVNYNRDVTVELQELVGGTTWTTRATSTHTAAEINPGSTIVVLGYWLVPFKFVTPFPISTTAGIWRFHVSQGAGTNNWCLSYITAGNYPYVTWGNATTTASSGNDTLVCVDKVIIDCSFQLKPVLGTGTTAVGVCGWICRNTDLTESGNALLEWENPATSSYTFTIDGHLIMGNHSGIRVGTEASPIAYAQQANLVFKSVPTVGTTAPSSIRSATGYYHDAGVSLFFYGEIPSRTFDTLNGNANAGQKIVTTTNATGWKSGDEVFIGRENIAGVGDTTINTMNGDAVGTTITLTNNIAGQNRLSGGRIINLSRYGITIKADGATKVSFIFHMVNRFTMSGVYAKGLSVRMGNNNAYFRTDLPANKSQLLIQDSAFNGSGYSNYFLEDGYYMLNEYGILFNRCNFVSNVPGYIFNKVASFFNGVLYITGPVQVKNCNILKSYAGMFTAIGNSTGIPSMLCNIENNNFENVQNGMAFNGINGTCFNNSVYSTPSTGIGILMLSAVNPLSFYGNTVNRCGTGIYVASQAVIIGTKILGNTFGNISPNTLDIDVANDCYLDLEIGTPTGFSTIGNNFANILSGSKLRISNATVTNDDKVYTKTGNFQRTGTGLTDTTCRTAGGYALRFQSTSSVNRLEWIFTIPTGNIQNKTMMVGIWCKINSATYYAGTHQKPRLTVDYDNGTVVYVEATATTDWQFLPLPFTPTTTYGQITVTVSTMTDATGSDAYVYFDDFKTLFPAESPLDTQSLDLWANGLPVTPPLATVLSANDVWSAVDTVDYGTDTIGNRLKKLKNPSLIVDGEIIL